MNNETMKYTIEGVLTTTSPLHITQPGESRWEFNARDGQGDYTKGKLGFPLTHTRSASVFLGANNKLRDDVLDDDAAEQTVSRREKVPVIPATTWRGMLRRGAARVIEDHVIENLGKKLSYSTYQGLHCGAISDKPDGVGPTTDEIRSARSHVFYGIFGGGPRMLQGMLRASDSLPVTSSLIEARLLPETLNDQALKGVYSRSLYSVSPVIRKDDFAGNVDGSSEAAEVVENFYEAYDAFRQKEVERKINNLKGGKEGESGERGVRAMSFREDVAIGVPFNVRLELKGTRAQVGMLLAAIDRRLPDGVGGRSSLGFGRLSGVLYVVDQTGNRVEALGVTDGNTSILEGASDYMEAMTDAVSALTLDDITRYMTSEMTDEEKKTKAEKKAKK